MAGNAVEAGRTVSSKVTATLLTFADGKRRLLTVTARIMSRELAGPGLATAVAS